MRQKDLLSFCHIVFLLTLTATNTEFVYFWWCLITLLYSIFGWCYLMKQLVLRGVIFITVTHLLHGIIKLL